jgi:hypothetical protein
MDRMCARSASGLRTPISATVLPVALACVLLTVFEASARNNIRSAFFDVYPDAEATVIGTVPSHPDHCGVCHYDFGGGGTRNLYGQRLELVLPDYPSNPNGRRQAVRAIENEDSDGDSFTTLTEVTDTVTFDNTPTFPGLTPTNLANVTNVDKTEIQNNLVPSTGADTQPPDVQVIVPNGGETVVGNEANLIEWSATDESGIAGVSIYVTYDDGASFDPIAIGISNTGSLTWYPANRPTSGAIVRVVATDNSFNEGSDDSDNPFTIISPAGGAVPSTLRDFDQPGSQPFDAGILADPQVCAICHGDYDAAVEPYANWQGSMMAMASRDPLFAACTTVSNQDAPDSGDLCLRCHIPRGWLRGRSIPTDGSQMLPEDHSGVSCDFCHRLVDPLYDPQANPPEDQAVLAALAQVPSNFANGMYVVDPGGVRRGPFVDANSGHPILVSPFHREAALCGTCHDVSNTAFSKDGEGNYPPNAFDAPPASYASHSLMPIERTYSEWFYSAYNSPEGVYAPQFGGNKDYVATCQDCHMRDVTGEGCSFGSPPTRTDLPLHDMTGGSTWLPALIAAAYPAQFDPTAVQNGISRARYMLQEAASLAAVQQDGTLLVTVTNETGHKLPTGYPEGRRIWINVRFYDAGEQLIGESGMYDPATGVLHHDPQLVIFEAKPGLDTDVAGIVGEEPGPSFHFVLNNRIYKDNRVPPRGFTNAAFEPFGGTPIGATYADGQHWYDAEYDIPAGAVSAQVILYYQSTSKEYVEYLRDANVTDDTGQAMYDLWEQNDRCPPEMMAEVITPVAPPVPGDFDLDGDADGDDYLVFADCLSGPDVMPAPTIPEVDPPTCLAVFDFEDDGDVDARDAAWFLSLFTGP